VANFGGFRLAASIAEQAPGAERARIARV
jgi:hypothetical protein